MTPGELVAQATREALDHQGDAESRRFLAALQERRFETTSCKGCGRAFFPPKPLCPRCGGGELEWAALPREGTLYAFTTQQKAIRFSEPDVLGIVELDGGAARMLTKIRAPIERLRIGMRLRLDFVEIEGGIVLPEFVPP